jgi:hypothetical protein
LPLSVDALGPDRYGLSIGDLINRGFHEVETRAASQTAGQNWQVRLAVNGPPHESDLTALNEEDLAERLASFRWTAAGQTITFSAAPLEGQQVWKWLLAAVIAALLAELALVAWPTLAGGRGP